MQPLQTVTARLTYACLQVYHIEIQYFRHVWFWRTLASRLETTTMLKT